MARERAASTDSGDGLLEASTGALAKQARALLDPWFKERRFPAGTLLWRERETAGQLVAIESGRVKIYRTLPGGRTVTLYLFGPDDVFGFLPFLDGRVYPASAQALDDVTAKVMPRGDLLEAVRARPEVTLTLFSLLGRRLRDAFDRIESLSTPGVVPRVASALQALLPGAATPPVLLDVPVSSAEFAAALGVSPETLSRAISKLVADGVLHRVGPRRLQVLDVAALGRAAQFAER